MGDLRDALKKAGLIDDKAEKRLKHEERVQKKELGREGLEAQRLKDDAERRARDEQKRGDTKVAQQRLDQERQRAEKWKRLLSAIESEAIRGGAGPRRFHFRDAEGHLPYLMVDDEIGRRLEAGELAIARLPENNAAAILPRALALELQHFRPELVLQLAGAGR
jgi:uncharacterized protein YaiL (DUF2058 family)